MNEILGNIYCWFETLYAQNLADYLWGYDCATGQFTNANLYNTIGFYTIGISLLISLTYYIFVDHPKLSKWWVWLGVLLINSTINLLLGHWITASKLLNGDIPQCLMYQVDSNGKIVSQLIYTSDCWGFGLSNFFVSAMFFVAFSFIVKWKSVACKYSPI